MPVMDQHSIQLLKPEISAGPTRKETYPFLHYGPSRHAASLAKSISFCFTETADVRLNGSNLSHMGRVEIKQQGLWHAVCSIGWDKHDADVVCRQLGFPEAVVEVGHGQFGSGSGPMWLTSVGCQGNETSLDQCVSAGWELEEDCGKRYGAGVICKMDNITDGNVL